MYKRQLKGQSKNEISISASYSYPRTKKPVDSKAIKAEVQRVMTDNVGIIRNREGLFHALNVITKYYDSIKDMVNETMDDFELQNMLMLSRLCLLYTSRCV